MNETDFPMQGSDWDEFALSYVWHHRENRHVEMDKQILE